MLHLTTLGEAERGFRDAAAEGGETLRCFVDQDVLALDAIAATLAQATRSLEPLFGGLDAALATTDERGFSRQRPRFRAADIDAYAVIEALFWGELTAEAEDHAEDRAAGNAAEGLGKLRRRHA